MVLENIPGWEIVVFFLLLFIFLLAGGIVAFVILSRLRWPYKYIVLEYVVGHGYSPTKRGRMRLIPFGDGGEEIFFLKGIKKWRVAYGKRIAKNQVAWAIGQDGYWYNITFGDLDKKLKEVGVIPVDRDVRLVNASVRKGIDHRYDSKTFFEKYGTALTIGMLIFAMIVFIGAMWFIFNQQMKIIAANAESARTAKEVMQLAGQVLNSVANIKSGSGAVT